MAKAIVVGREQAESQLLLRGTEILSVFGIVYESELEGISELSRGVFNDLSSEDLRKVDGDTDKRIQVSIGLLQPDSLDRRVRLLLTEMPWDYPCEQKMSYKEKEEKQKEAIIDFTAELLKAPEDLKKVIPVVCTHISKS